MHEALKMVNSVMEKFSKLRSQIDTIFPSWYAEILKLTDKIGVNETVLRKTNLQRNRSNTPSSTLQEHYKRLVGIDSINSA